MPFFPRWGRWGGGVEVMFNASSLGKGICKYLNNSH